MKSCARCNVTVTGNRSDCPLCQGALLGESGGAEVFPYVPLARKQHSLLFRFSLLCSALVVIASITVNILLPDSGYWALFVVAGVATVWPALIIAIRKRNNLLKHFTYQLSAVTVLAVLWDLITGWRGWSVDFVIPISFMALMATVAILARILKMPPEIHIIYSFALVIYGIIPLFFIISGLSTVIIPSIICVASALFSLVALFIFEGKNMKEELKRRLHL